VGGYVCVVHSIVKSFLELVPMLLNIDGVGACAFLSENSVET